MIDFIKKNTFIGLIFLITLILGFVTFLTFIDKSFLQVNRPKSSVPTDRKYSSYY